MFRIEWLYDRIVAATCFHQVRRREMPHRPELDARLAVEQHLHHLRRTAAAAFEPIYFLGKLDQGADLAVQIRQRRSANRAAAGE